ncbi:hypothetical protein [Haloarcula halophila]|uniref:hypothetical protein n=1 Tax=Haloarcula TaxID=2237 RepID=UPI0023E36C01|nr:hypothetical protein [Halomicroarcula sp. DFY41]
MSVDTALRALADHLDTSAGAGTAVEHVSAATDGEELTTELTIEFPLELAAGAETVTVTDSEYRDGSVHVDISMTVDAETLCGTTADGGDRAVPSVQDTETAAGSEETAERNAKTGPGAGDTGGVPAYKDPERLREVYEENNSFAEMKDALDVDVTAQTVRRNMIKHGIHEPETNAGAEADDSPEPDDARPAAEPESRAFDDADLPEGITPEDVRDAAAESSSLHGAQLALDLDMSETRSLLKELGVLEHVTGRIADHEDDPDPAEIERQIYDSLTARADGGENDD